MLVVPMIQVADVAASSQWYQRTLGLVSGHGGDEFEMLFAGEPYTSALLLQLHRWEAHEHGFLGSPDVPVGNGSSLWFGVADRAASTRRGRERPMRRPTCSPSRRGIPSLITTSSWCATPMATCWPCTRRSAPTLPIDRSDLNRGVAAVGGCLPLVS